MSLVIEAGDPGDWAWRDQADEKIVSLVGTNFGKIEVHGRVF